MSKLGRNDPCPCGSGRKYKRCCQRSDEAAGVVARRAPAPSRAAPPPSPEVAQALIEGETPYRLARSLDHPHRQAALAAAGHPWTGAREPAARVAAMAPEALVAWLAERGIDGTEGAFVRAAEGHDSAWAVGMAWWDAAEGRLAPREQPFLGLAAVALWRRSLDRPSVEIVADQIEAGYRSQYAATQAERNRACGAWLDVWPLLRRFLPESVRSLGEVVATWPDLRGVRFWVSDLLNALSVALETTTEYAERGAAFCEALVARFPDEPLDRQLDIRSDGARMRAAAGDRARAVAEAERLIEAYPTSAAGYCAWADVLLDDGRGAGNPADLARAIEVLERAAAIPVEDAAEWSLWERLKAARALLA